jgi:DNA primase
MISTKNRLTVLSILNDVMGVGTSLKNDEVVFYCPFCHHHKKKLNVNLETQKFHCWVCNAKCRITKSLLLRLNVDRSNIQKINNIYGDSVETFSQKSDERVILYLPKEFKPLHFAPKSINPVYNKAIHYLKNRGVSLDDIAKYNIGYCETGIYQNRIIVPSYSEEGNLNYFIARSFYEDTKLKYKLPPVSRDIIMFENQINWNEPIVLIEGVYDSFSVKRNAIPLLGKYILPNLKKKIFDKGVKEVVLLLDSDAVLDSTKHTEFFIKNGIRVKNIIPNSNKDAGELGFDIVNTKIKEFGETRWDNLIIDKLKDI